MLQWKRIVRIATTASEELSAVMAWWLQELKESARTLIERVQPNRIHNVVVFAGEDVVRIQATKGSQALEEIIVATDEQGEWPASVQSFWPVDRPQQLSVEIVLPQDKLLSRPLTLPAVTDREIAKILELRLERELPLGRDRVYVDWKIGSRSKESAQVCVHLGIVRRQEVDRWTSLVRQWGWKPNRISAKEPTTGVQFDFLETRRQINANVKEAFAPMARIAASLLLAIVVVNAGKWTYERLHVNETLAAAKAQLKQQAQMSARLQRESEPITQLSSLMEMPSASQVLADLTTLLPTETWASDVEIQVATDNQAMLRLVGYTPNATDLVTLIENSEPFGEVQLVSSAAAANSNGESPRDRVELNLKWAPHSSERVAGVSAP